MKRSNRHRNLQLTEKGKKALEHARRKRLYPNLDPEKDWIEIPTWMLNSREGS